MLLQNVSGKILLLIFAQRSKLMNKQSISSVISYNTDRSGSLIKGGHVSDNLARSLAWPFSPAVIKTENWLLHYPLLCSFRMFCLKYSI
jgi:hypothetical protein